MGKTEKTILIILTILSAINTILIISMKSDIKAAKENSWNAYDTADATYQKVRNISSDVESIFHKVME